MSSIDIDDSICVISQITNEDSPLRVRRSPRTSKIQTQNENKSISYFRCHQEISDKKEQSLIKIETKSELQVKKILESTPSPLSSSSSENFKKFRRKIRQSSVSPSSISPEKQMKSDCQNELNSSIIVTPEALNCFNVSKSQRKEISLKKLQKKTKERSKNSDSSRSLAKKNSKKGANKKIDEFFGKDQVFNQSVELLINEDTEDIVIKKPNLPSERKFTKMVDFSEMFRNASLKDQLSSSKGKKNESKKRKHKSEEKTPKSKVKDSLLKIEPPLLVEDNRAIIELMDIESDQETIIYELDASLQVLESSNETSSISLKVETENIWINKHCPKKTKDSICEQDACDFLKDWILNYENSDAISNCSDSIDENEKDLCLLVCGPVGSGKTSLVYTVAAEINYKVFELNCSSKRNSKVISKLKEATVSHTVSRRDDSSSKDIHDSRNAIQFTSTQKNNLLTSFFKRDSAEKRVEGKPKNISSYFNASQSKKSFIDSQDDIGIILNGIISESNSLSCNGLSLSTNSIILIDDVDVIFEEDVGFWPAVLTLVENSRKPVILTATRNIENIQREIREMSLLRLQKPSSDKIEKQLFGILYKEIQNPIYKMEENTRNDWLFDDQLKQRIQFAISKCKKNEDIRRSINNLQFEFSPCLYQQIDLNIQNYESQPLQVESLENYVKLTESLSVLDLLSNEFQLNLDSQPSNELPSFAWDQDYNSRDFANEIAKTMNEMLSNPKHNDKMNAQFSLCVNEIQRYFGVSTAKCDHLYTDIIPALAELCSVELERFELFREHTRKSRRYLHYLDQIGFFLTDASKNFLHDYLNASE